MCHVDNQKLNCFNGRTNFAVKNVLVFICFSEVTENFKYILEGLVRPFFQGISKESKQERPA